MTLAFRILPSRGLVYVRYDGHVHFRETSEVFAAYMQHPDMRPGQKQLVDLSHVTDWDNNYSELMKIQASKADAFVGTGDEVLLVYYAPSEHTQQMARMVIRSWEDVPGVIPLLQETEADALAVLGQPETRIDDLLEKT